ncbi:MAG: dihydrofolate reductase [Alsobacter sp.]
MPVPVVIVVAAADNGVIGRDNGLIWRLKTDLRHFRGLTLGRPLVMGRKTFESIGKPLPGRETIVLTRDPSFRPQGAAVAHDLPAALALGQEIAARLGADSVVIGGGDQVYRQALPVTDRIHLTEVHVSPQGDALFPSVDRTLFRETSREDHPTGPDDEHAFSFVDYVRRAPAAAAAS